VRLNGSPARRGFGESVQLGGYFLIDAKNLDEAIGIAARIPMALKGTVEIRPVVEITGLPRERDLRPAS